MPSVEKSRDAAAVEFPMGTVRGCAPGDRAKVGRKHLNQSRANEIRARLAEWKRLPESSRPTLRALAQELGTTHQLLSHFLKNWASYWSKEYKHREAEIRIRAARERRDLTPFEEQQAQACGRRHMAWMVTAMLQKTLGDVYAKIQAGRAPSKTALRMVKLGMTDADLRPISEKILRSLSKGPSNNLPKSNGVAHKSFRRAERLAGNSGKTHSRLRVETTGSLEKMRPRAVA